ncbi:hypothetical protein K440DRAFT_636192 [Wilcoxina mikolae CBS 423.85]|nr:hypothetical protein K440DRAFT_636192 [Wilcoxina mikolae CBS 423.85]
MTSTTFRLCTSDSDSDSDSGLAFKVDHLSHDNYFIWSFDLKHVLCRDNLWDIVSGAETSPPPTAPPAKAESFRRRQSRALGFIKLTAPATGLYHYGVYSTDGMDPKELWDKIQEGSGGVYMCGGSGKSYTACDWRNIGTLWSTR